MYPAQIPPLRTEQEAFWAGDFGDAYVDRNTQAQWLASNIAFFARALQRTGPIATILELGANIGLNLKALRQLLPTAGLSGVEINSKAAAELRRWGEAEVFETSLLRFDRTELTDLVFTKNVLIHIAPAELALAYETLYRCSRAYVLLAEYYNPTPVTVDYRGNADRLFKRDFAGEMLDRYNDLRLIDYGFCYRRDPHFPQDDSSWFLLEKSRR